MSVINNRYSREYSLPVHVWVELSDTQKRYDEGDAVRLLLLHCRVESVVVPARLVPVTAAYVPALQLHTRHERVDRLQ